MSTAQLTVADLPFLGGRIVRADYVESAIAVPVGTSADEVARLGRQYITTWRGADHTTGELLEAPRQCRTVGRRTHWSLKAVRDFTKDAR